MYSAKKISEYPLTNLIEIDHQVPLVIRRNKRAKRMYLRYNPNDYNFSLTLPQRTRLSEGEKFVQSKRDWIAQTLSKVPQKQQFGTGSILPILGEVCKVRYERQLPGSFALMHQELQVNGRRDQIPTIIQDSLKKIIRNEIKELADYKAQQINRSINRITLRDTCSRWGSCTTEHNLMFSWRLVFAPYEVLDYVVSHEVAHLRHMNHGTAFWRTVEELCPDYLLWKDWLKFHGSDLYRFTI
ncbi:MAG: M48 family metallopeptidase [Rickettsiales bacterium]|nr:M48 family metallopeptidase [Rickettsiales bacterium]